MRTFARILFCSACLLSLAAAPAAYADDEDDAPKSRRTAKEKREARRNKGKEEAAAPKGNFGKEMAALGEAAAMLSQVKDEAGAIETADKICRKFAAMPAITNGTDSELELLAKAQNRVNDQMERLMSTPYFLSSGLQEAWTLMTDHFSRRSVQRKRRK